MSLLNNSSTGPVSRRWLGQLGTLSPALPSVPCLILGFKPPSDDQGLPALPRPLWLEETGLGGRAGSQLCHH